MYNEKQRKAAEALVGRMVARAIEMEGTVTVSRVRPGRDTLLSAARRPILTWLQGEHGVGLVKRDYLPSELGQDTVDLMRKLKMAFDPLCLLNCEKIVRIDRNKPNTKSPIVPPKGIQA